jgi:hypothetical protein
MLQHQTNRQKRFFQHDFRFLRDAKLCTQRSLYFDDERAFTGENRDVSMI